MSDLRVLAALTAFVFGGCKGSLRPGQLPPVFVETAPADLRDGCPSNIETSSKLFGPRVLETMKQDGFALVQPGEKASFIIRPHFGVVSCHGAYAIVRLALVVTGGGISKTFQYDRKIPASMAPDYVAESGSNHLLRVMLQSRSMERWAKSAPPPTAVAPTTVVAEIDEAQVSASAPPQVRLGEGWVVAVLDVRDLGEADPKLAIDPTLLLSIASQLRVHLSQRGAKVVAKGDMDAMLKTVSSELKKDSYSACYDDACQIELGKAVAASHILRSQIARFGSQCVLNAEVFDLRSETTVTAASSKGDCTPESFLTMSEETTRGL